MAVVAWIYMLGRRDRRDPAATRDEPDDDDDREDDRGDEERAAPAGEGGVRRGRGG